MGDRVRIKQGTTSLAREADAVEDLRGQIRQDDAALTLVFCSPRYDIARLGAELRAAFPGVLLGCTSAGQIGPRGYQQGGLTGATLASDEISANAYTIRTLAACQGQASRIAHDFKNQAPRRPGSRAFGMVLVDGLSRVEERLAAALYQSLGDVPIVGGSAGDDLRFERTMVLGPEGFEADTAVVVLIETTLPFSTFKHQHFMPTSRRFVITGARPEERVVTEIDGGPAAEAYAALVGVPVTALDERVFAANPVMLSIGGDLYVRSIQKANPNGSLTFYCAIDEGLVLRLGRGVDAVAAAASAFDAVADKVGHLEAIVGFDCVLRRVDFERDGITEDLAGELSRHKVIGVSTYGETYNSTHVNQTLTGVAIGG